MSNYFRGKNISKKDKLFSSLTKPLILLLLFLSGTCGLIYEIVWIKMLTIVIGNTVFSITTVLTAFMGGLALGSFLAGMLSDKIKNPLRSYGLLEGGIGIYALLLPIFIGWTEPLFRFIYQNTDVSFYSFSILRFVICGILLLIPTALMGATLPILSKYLTKESSRIGETAALLYGVNTLGAVLGSFVSGFVLIPTLGISKTIYIAALINILISITVFLLCKRVITDESVAPIEAVKSRKESEAKAREVTPYYNNQTLIVSVLLGIGFSGLASMIYQIAWTRILLLSIGSSVYAFSLIITTFICGIALGSIVISKFIDRGKKLVLWMALLEAAIGISALGIVHLFGILPLYMVKYIFNGPHSFQYIHYAEFATIFVLILVPTFLMGATVPVAIKICTTDVTRAGRFFGNVYSVNTLGSIIGTFIAGFLLIPWTGSQNSIYIAVAINIIIAGALVLSEPTLSFSKRAVSALLTVVFASVAWYLIPPWDGSLLTSGPYLYANTYKDAFSTQGVDLQMAMKEGRQTLFFKEGLNALVSVHRSADGDLNLRINGKVDASIKGDEATQLMLGHLPLLLHKDADDALVIGLGSGMTLSAVERHSVRSIDVVEIEPVVVEANKYFEDFTNRALNDRRVNLIVGDGRNHLALTDKQYDVIISEPSNPWISGMANLFTREFFETTKNRLKENGVMCQWVHTYSMSPVDFKAIIHTFHTIFPHVTVWEASIANDYLLIGSMQDFNIDAGILLNRLSEAGLRTDLAKMDMRDLSSFINKLVITEDMIPKYTRDALLHTDDNALLEYSAPKALLENRPTQLAQLLDELYQYRLSPDDLLKLFHSTEITKTIKNELSKTLQARKIVLSGFINYYKGNNEGSIQMFKEALTINPGEYDANYMLVRLYYQSGKRLRESRQLNEAAAFYNRSIEVIDNFIKTNAASLSNHFELEVIYARAYQDLGAMAIESNRMKDATEALERSLSGGVHLPEAHANLGAVYGQMGKEEEAIAHLRHAIELDPYMAPAYINLGNILLKQGRSQEAIDVYLQAKKLRPNFALINYSLGRAYFMRAEWIKAEKELLEALKLNPNFTEAQQSLEIVQNNLHR